MRRCTEQANRTRLNGANQKIDGANQKINGANQKIDGVDQQTGEISDQSCSATRLMRLVAGLVLAAVLVGCSSNSEPDSETGIDVSGVSIFQEGDEDTSDEVETQDGAEDPEDSEVLAPDASAEGLEGKDLEAFVAARYEAYWDAFDAARRSPSATPSTDHPALLGLAAGDQLDQSYEQVIALFEIGEAMRESDEPSIEGTDSPTEHRVQVELVDDALANITACTVADDERYNVESDEAVEQNVLSVASRSTMVISDGQWKIIRAEATSIEQGVAGCWLEGEEVYPY